MRVALVYGHSDWIFDKRISIATPPAREKSAGALERPYGPGQGLTRKEPFCGTETRCGFDGLDERNKFPLLLKLAFGFLRR